jgi:CBS domain-containing protein
VWSIGPNAMGIDAIQLMDEKDVAVLPVVDHGTLLGIVSDRDYTKNHPEGKDLQGDSCQ